MAAVGARAAGVLGRNGYQHPSPRHNALYSNWRRNSNGEASRMARFNPDLEWCGLARSCRLRSSARRLLSGPGATGAIALLYSPVWKRRKQAARRPKAKQLKEEWPNTSLVF